VLGHGHHGEPDRMNSREKGNADAESGLRQVTKPDGSRATPRVNSRQKGARGERQWRDELRADGYEARRGQQFCGSAESPDVVCDERGGSILR
jgi:hypothetical protein